MARRWERDRRLPMPDAGRRALTYSITARQQRAGPLRSTRQREPSRWRQRGRLNFETTPELQPDRAGHDDGADPQRHRHDHDQSDERQR